MSFEVFVMWYRHGEQVTVPFEGVRAAFGPAAAAQQAEGFRVLVGGQEQAYVFATPDAEGQVMSVMVSRPGGPPQFWDSIVTLMRLVHGLCVWPGDAQAV